MLPGSVTQAMGRTPMRGRGLCRTVAAGTGPGTELKAVLAERFALVEPALAALSLALALTPAAPAALEAPAPASARRQPASNAGGGGAGGGWQRRQRAAPGSAWISMDVQRGINGYPWITTDPGQPWISMDTGAALRIRETSDLLHAFAFAFLTHFGQPFVFAFCVTLNSQQLLAIAFSKRFAHSAGPTPPTPPRMEIVKCGFLISPKAAHKYQDQFVRGFVKNGRRIISKLHNSFCVRHLVSQESKISF